MPRPQLSAPKATVHSHLPLQPKTCCDSAAAAEAMMISSNVDQPTFWATLSTLGAYEPLRPSGARSSTMPGTRASAPISAARPRSAFPATAPTTIASKAVRSESAGTSSAPITITRSETERFPQSSVESRPLSTRRRSGTGSMPQLGVLSLTLLPSPALPGSGSAGVISAARTAPRCSERSERRRQ